MGDEVAQQHREAARNIATGLDILSRYEDFRVNLVLGAIYAGSSFEDVADSDKDILDRCGWRYDVGFKMWVFYS